MQLIFDKEHAAQLREKYTVLDLETITKDGVTLDVFCVIPADKINLGELTQLEHNTKLHNHFVQAFKDGNYNVCKDLHEHLMGKFGGEVDTFYDEIIGRIQSLEKSNVT